MKLNLSDPKVEILHMEMLILQIKTIILIILLEIKVSSIEPHENGLLITLEILKRILEKKNN